MFSTCFKFKVQNVWLSEQEHLRQFLDAADWFMDNQDDNGGWPSQVGKRQFIHFAENQKFKKVTFNRGSKKYPGAGEVAPGWYGAMCQVCFNPKCGLMKQTKMADSNTVPGYNVTYYLHQGQAIDNVTSTRARQSIMLLPPGPGNISFGASPFIDRGQQLSRSCH